MHRAACIAEWRPELDQHEWFLRMLKAADKMEEPGQTGMHFIGSQNSGKTEVISALMNQYFIEDPSHTAIYISGPHLEAANMGIWTNFLSNYQSLCEFMGWDYDKTYQSSRNIINLKIHPKAGYAKVVTVAKQAMFQGRKPRSPTRGWLFVVVDETGTMPTKASQEFLGLLDNLLSPKRTRLITACNFRSVHGLDGAICKPEGREWDTIDADRDHEWPGEIGAKVYRFDCYRSPNVLAGKVIYDYLVTQEDIARALKKYRSDKHPKFLEQFRSTPDTSGESRRITSSEKIRMGGAYGRPQYTGDPVKRFAFVDPSLGGDLYQLIVAEEKVALENGVRRNVLVPVYADNAPIEARKTLDSRDVALIKSVAPTIMEFAVGVPIRQGMAFPPEWQGALWVRQQLQRLHVPPENCGWDGSFRATVARACHVLIGADSVAIEYSTAPPEDFGMPSGIGLAKDLYKDMQTFLWHLSAEMLEAGYWREIERLPRMVSQLTQRLWEPAGSKIKLEDKKEFVKKMGNESPDEQDAFSGLCYVAYIRGAQSSSVEFDMAGFMRKPLKIMR